MLFSRLFAQLFVLFSLGLFLSLGLLLPGQASMGSSQAETESAYVSGELLLKFAPGLSTADAQQTLVAQNLAVLAVNEQLGVLRVAVPPGREVTTARVLAARPEVLFAEPNYLVRAIQLPDDAGFSNQWYLDKIRAPAAWDISTGDSQQIIAVLDTGVDLDHPDLIDKLLPGYDFVNDDPLPDDDQDCNGSGHGTHVAGIAAAATNNQIGIAGLDWQARLLPVKVLDRCGDGTYAAVADGVTYAVDNGAKIINLSLGGTCPEPPPQTLKTAIDYADVLGALVIAAAGNTGVAVLCPAAYDNVVAVAATTGDDTRASFSNYGPEVEIAAPGMSIYSTMRNGGYGLKNGTSMAAPMVAGLAALVWSRNPHLTNLQVRAAISTTALDLGQPGRDSFFGWGRIDAYQAVLAAPSILTLSPPPHFLTDDETPPVPVIANIGVYVAGTGAVTWSASVSPAVGWLTIVPGSEAGVSTAGQPDFVTLQATRPLTYGTYSTSLIVTTEVLGQLISHTVTPQISYLPKLYRQRFILLLKNAPLPGQVSQ